jgi:hypothetical protein
MPRLENCADQLITPSCTANRLAAPHAPIRMQKQTFRCPSEPVVAPTCLRRLSQTYIILNDHGCSDRPWRAQMFSVSHTRKAASIKDCSCAFYVASASTWRLFQARLMAICLISIT